MNIRAVFHVLALWLLGFGLAWAQSNSIESFNVSQQGGKVVVRIQTKNPLPAVPPSFTVVNPARIAIDFAGTANALGRASQEIGEGELRSMNLVQGAERSRMVLNLRRAVTHEMSDRRQHSGRDAVRRPLRRRSGARRRTSPKGGPT